MRYKIIISVINKQSTKFMEKHSTIDRIQRIHPEYRGISQKYSKAKKERLEIEQKKKKLNNNLNFFERTKQSLDSKLKTKKQQLKWLQSVRDRHLNDIRYKLYQEDLNKKRIEELKLHSEIARMTSRKNVFAALQNSRMQKMKTSEQVKNQLLEIKKHKQEAKQQMGRYYTIRSKQLMQEKELRKSKINKFYLRKNKVLLNIYNDKIKDEQMMSIKSGSQINYIETRKSTLDKKIMKKKNKLKSIEDEIMRIRLQSSDYSFFDNNFQNNKIQVLSKSSNVASQKQVSNSPFHLYNKSDQQV